jgi:hypothetical protein
MAIRNNIWTVSTIPAQLSESQLPNEKTLEDMIVAAPAILSEEWMLIGRQERTNSGGIVDLLAIAPDGALVVIELKRGRTPRDVVAQAIDYAAWVETLQTKEIAAIYGRFCPDRDLAADFKARFAQDLDEEPHASPAWPPISRLIPTLTTRRTIDESIAPAPLPNIQPSPEVTDN